MMQTAVYAEEDVLVIGAGPAGIAAAYALQQAGIRYKVVDRADRPGITWDSLYPSLTLNTTRFYSHMPGMRFPLHYGFFPTAKQYYTYLRKFIARHNFNIQLNTDVYRVAPEGSYWRVEMNTGVYLYKTVISATGIFGNPVMPAIPGMADFRGELYHAHDFKDPAQVKGKRVLVVGSGPSGVDIAVAAAEVAAEVQIAIRSGITLKRRYPFGMPAHFWLMLGLFLPQNWCNKLMKLIGKQGYPEQEKYGLKKPAPGAGGITAYQGPELLNAVKAGKVTPVLAPIQFDAQGATFADDTYHTFDTVIMATGYLPVLHQYLDIEMQYDDSFWEAPAPCEWEIGPNGQRGFPLLDRDQHPNGRQVVGYPGLYLVGVYYKGKGAMHNMNIEAAIAAQQIQAYLAAFRTEQTHQTQTIEV